MTFSHGCSRVARVTGLLGALAFLLVFAGGAFAADAKPEAKKEPGKISGYMFGDYYFVSGHHDSSIEGQNGFWFRRIYFTYDQKVAEAFQTRFRLELNSPGDFKTSDTMKPFLKDAYLKYTQGRGSVVFGLSPSPTWEVVEPTWGYRAVEKTPLDLFKMGSSRDMGIAFVGHLDKDKTFAYHLMVGNGADTRSETNEGKKVYLSLGKKLTKQFMVELYADREDLPADAKNSLMQAFAAYSETAWRVGVLTATQKRERAGQPDVNTSVTSVYGVSRLSNQWKIYARWDSVSKPIPDGDKISYFVMSKDAKPTLMLVGLDFAATPDVHILPSFTTVSYSDSPTGTNPGDDTIFKLTVFWNFR